MPPLIAALALMLAGCGAAAPSEHGDAAAAAAAADVGQDRPVLGLMSTLPIYWPESAGFGDILSEEGEKGRVRQALEREFELEPLDNLDAASLRGIDRLMLAQPRALSAQENVALDEWVRGGGRVIVFADPLLTGHSRFAIGDRRRPQDVVLISPILSRWGLELTYDEEQPEGARTVSVGGIRLPVDLAGAFRITGGGEDAACALSDDGLLARCRIGAGEAILLADAALLEDGDAGSQPDDGGADTALAALLALRA